MKRKPKTKKGENSKIEADIISQIRKQGLEVISLQEGKVESITAGESIIVFADGSRVAFPVWRLIRAGADDLGIKVKHHLVKVGTLLVSDLKAISHVVPYKGETEKLEELSPETLKRIGEWEKCQ